MGKTISSKTDDKLYISPTLNEEIAAASKDERIYFLYH